MRLLKHIINRTLWSLLGLTVALILLIQLAPVQRWLGQRVADAIGSKLGTEVSVGRVDFGFFNRLIIDDVRVLDQQQSPMLHLITLPKERITLNVTYMPALNLFNLTAAKGSDNMDLYRRFTNLNTRATLNQQTNVVVDSLAVLLSDTPGTLMSAFLVTFYEQYFEQYAPLYKKIRDALVGQYADNDFVRHIDSRLRSALIAGMEAPDIALPNPQGDTLRLSALRGKVVLIDFWASWCGPCRRENPHVVRLYERFHDKGFEIFSVSLDQSRDKWLDAIQKDGLRWPCHVSDLRGWNSAAGRLYGISSIPATVLVDREGNILARNLRGAELERKLTEIFAQ